MPDHRRFLAEALREARKAWAEGEIPIGAVIVDRSGRIIARGHNQMARRRDPTAHAEVVALRRAISRLGPEARSDWTLYSTVEPCPMCLGMAVMLHLGGLVWAAPDRRAGAADLLGANPYMRRHRDGMEVVACPDPVLAQECADLHARYWLARGRPDVLEPAPEVSTAEPGGQTSPLA
ncbi:MAG: nucleoside deaminase [Bacillota bacterium]